MATANSDDSDEDDMFIMGGPVQPVSIHSLSANVDTIDDEDDDDDDIEEVPVVVTKKKGKGRPSKRDREPVPKKKAEPKKTKKSVFDSASDDSDDDVVCVSDTPKSFGKEGVNAALAQARHVLSMEANENVISKQAEREAKMAVERSEREREEERRREERRKELDRAKEKSGGKPILLTVRHGDNDKVKMKIKDTDSVLKMLEPFCKKFGLDSEEMKMVFDGDEMGEEDTPKELDLDGGEMFDVVRR